MHLLKAVLRVLFGAAFVGIGITHFTDPGFYLKIMPDYIPTSLHLPAVYISGVAEVGLGLLLIVPASSRLAAWGLIALLIAVFPANIYAYQHQHEIWPESDHPTLQLIRLPLQGVMIAWAYWYARSEHPRTEPAVHAD